MLTLDDYFNWLLKQYFGSSENEYKKLLIFMAKFDFVSVYDKDLNREADGVILRDFYLESTKLLPNNLPQDFYLNSCSVLELILSLITRISEVTGEIDYQINKKWLYKILANLNLASQTNENYNEDIINERLCTFINRTYTKNGSGNVFMINNKNYDMRSIEIWYQMHLYLKEELNYV